MRVGGIKDSNIDLTNITQIYGVMQKVVSSQSAIKWIKLRTLLEKQ